MRASRQRIEVRLTARRRSLGMGRILTLTAEARLTGGEPAAGWLLLPYVDGRRWGAHELADATGRAIWHLPLPNPGIAEIRAEARPPAEAPPQTGACPPASFTGGWLPQLPWLLVGYPLADKARISNPVRVEVRRRDLCLIPADPEDRKSVV